MAGLECSTDTGELTVNGVSMHTAAWCAHGDLTPLWIETVPRGADTVVPYRQGAIPRRRRLNVSEHSIPLLISGDANPAGVEVCSDDPDDFWANAVANLVYLRDNVITPTEWETDDGTVAASIVVTSTFTVAARIHVLGIRLGQKIVGQNAWRASLEISIPQGRFFEAP